MSKTLKTPRAKSQHAGDVYFSNNHVEAIAKAMFNGEIKFASLRENGLIKREWLTLGEIDAIFGNVAKKIIDYRAELSSSSAATVVHDIKQMREQISKLKALVVQYCPAQAVEALLR